MQEKSCKHQWEMINLKPCFLITECCFKCQKISTYYSFEERPPLEEYKDGDHFWNVLGHAQSIRFDLKCNECGKQVNLEELAGLMMCPGCDENCKVFKLMTKSAKDRVWIFVAFSFLPSDERKQLNKEQISVLEEYFNQRRNSSTSSIKIVSGDLIDDISICYGDMIKDADMLSSKPPSN